MSQRPNHRHLVGGLGTLRRPVRACHSRPFRPHRLSVLLAMCPEETMSSNILLISLSPSLRVFHSFPWGLFVLGDESKQMSNGSVLFMSRLLIRWLLQFVIHPLNKFIANQITVYCKPKFIELRKQNENKCTSLINTHK